MKNEIPIGSAIERIADDTSMPDVAEHVARVADEEVVVLEVAEQAEVHHDRAGEQRAATSLVLGGVHRLGEQLVADGRDRRAAR